MAGDLSTRARNRGARHRSECLCSFAFLGYYPSVVRRQDNWEYPTQEITDDRITRPAGTTMKRYLSADAVSALLSELFDNPYPRSPRHVHMNLQSDNPTTS